MIKKYIVLLLLAFITSPGMSKERYKGSRNIYLLDITLSMFGKDGGEYIFEDVRKELVKAIEAITDETTEIVVVTYQDQIIDTWEEVATKEGKKEIIQKLNAISVDNVPKQNTNIHGAWKKGRSLINPQKLNVMFLLTDGEHSVRHTPIETLYEEVQSWGDFARDRDYYAFLVELTAQAKDEKLREIVRATENAQIIQGIEFFIVSVEDRNPVINTHDELAFSLKITGDRLNNIPADFTYQIHLEDDNFEIRNNAPREIKDGKSTVELRPRKPLNEIQEDLDQVSRLRFQLWFDEEKFPQIKLLDKNIFCQVNNKKEKVLLLEVL